jgi:hypothetical protein
MFALGNLLIVQVGCKLCTLNALRERPSQHKDMNLFRVSNHETIITCAQEIQPRGQSQRIAERRIEALISLSQPQSYKSPYKLKRLVRAELGKKNRGDDRGNEQHFL